jgi:hypothetical protein
LLLTCMLSPSPCSELIKYIPQVMLQELDKAKPVEVSNVLWGLAKLSLTPTSGSKVFLEAIGDHMLWTMDQYGCEELTRSLWSFASLSHYPGKRFLWTAESQLLERVALLTPQDVGNVLWAFGKFKYKPTRMLDELPLHIGRRLSDFKPQELSCLLYGYTQSRHYHASLLDAAAPVIMIRAPEMSHQDLVIAIWCYGIFGHKPMLTGPAVAAALNPISPQPYSQSNNHHSSPSSSLPSTSNPSSVSSSSSASRSHSNSAINHPLAAAAINSSSSGLSSFIDALGSVIFRRLPGLRPVGLSNVIKALGGLKAPSKPEIQALAREAAAIAASRINEFKLLEMSSLLYGLSLMQYNDHAIYKLCVQQSIRILEQREVSSISHPLPSGLLRGEEGWIVRNQSWNDRAPVDFSPAQLAEDSSESSSSSSSLLYRPRAFDHKTINSIVASCVSVGLIPSDLVEVAEMKGLRVRNPSSYRKVSRGHQGHPHFSSSRWAAGGRKLPAVPDASGHSLSTSHFNGEAATRHRKGRAGEAVKGSSRRSRGYHSVMPPNDDSSFASIPPLVDLNELATNGAAALKVHLTSHSHSHSQASAVTPSD